jgi:ketosteroid isomerase-like protein
LDYNNHVILLMLAKGRQIAKEMDTELSQILFKKAIERYHQALGEFSRGNAQPLLDMFSAESDACLANPVGPMVMGHDNIVAVEMRAAADLQEGEVIGFEDLTRYISGDLAYLVENEHFKVKAGGKPEFTQVSLRVTSIFRNENSGWKIVHRHADALITEGPAETMAQE